MAKRSNTRPDWLQAGEHLSHCTGCGYLLRGLPQTGRCPECGLPFDRRWCLWRDGRQLVMSRSGVLPLRCVKCGEEVSELEDVRLVWKHPAIFLILLVACLSFSCGLVVYIVVSMVTLKTATIRIGLCARHRRQRRNASIVMGLVLGLAAVLGVLGIVFGQALLGVSMSLSIFLAVGIWLYWGRPVRATRIGEDFIRLSGVCEAVLADLPQFRSPGIVPPAGRSIPYAAVPPDHDTGASPQS